MIHVLNIVVTPDSSMCNTSNFKACISHDMLSIKIIIYELYMIIINYHNNYTSFLRSFGGFSLKDQ